MNEQTAPQALPDTAGSSQDVTDFQAYGNAELAKEEGIEGAITDRTPGQAFMRALKAMEQHRNVDHIVDQFSSQCKLWRQSYARPYEASGGARHFWDQYLNQFESIQTDFTHVIERDDLSILEWESRGVLQGGRPIFYRGVSILEYGDEAKVQNFRTYFDSSHFLPTHGPATSH